MQTFDYDITQFDPRNPYKGDEKLPVRFYMGAIQNDEETERVGRPIFVDTECIQIFNSKDNIIDRPVRDSDRKRWPGAYAAWKQGGDGEPGATGTRLSHWPIMTRAQVEEFKFFKVYTVEQLAELPDSTVQKIMGAPKLKQLAMLAVEAAKGEEPFLRMQGELEKRDGQIAELSSEVRRLTRLIEEKLKNRHSAMSALQKQDTILYEVQQACIQLSLPSPNGVYDSSDENVVLMGSVANLAGIMVSEAFDWQQLRKTFSLTGDAIKTAFDLPADFSRFVDGTGWSLAVRRPVSVLSPQQWATMKAWMSSSMTIIPVCRILADQLAFMTAPKLGEVITFEYIDANWVIDADVLTTFKQKANKNGDVPRFDWLLMMLAVKLKWLEMKGLSTAAVQSDFNERLQQLTQRNQMGQVLTLSGPVPGGFRMLDGISNVPDSFG